MRIAVVGGGIAGLAAAWEARDRAEVTVFEPATPGGKLRTRPFEGRKIDCGADAFLTRVPQAVALAAELGIEGDLVAPSAGQALVCSGGRLHPFPADGLLGAPRRLTPLVHSSLVGPIGVARAALDLVLPATDWPDDVSVHELIRRRFGSQVATRIVDPLVGSIHAGRTEDLSAAATAPQLLGAARRSRSLMRALRDAVPSGTGASGPVFLAPSGGMQVLADRLVDRLRQAGVTFVSSAVDVVLPRPCGVTVDLANPAGAPDAAQHNPAGAPDAGQHSPAGAPDAGRDSTTFDGVVLAVAAAAAAGILGDNAPAGLAAIPTASVTLVTMEYAEADLAPPPATSGVLVARSEGTLMTACSFAGTKWPHWSVPGRVLLRVSCGRDGDQRQAHLGDVELVERLAGELRRLVGARGEPVAWRVTRWPDAFPQYRVGHLGAVATMEQQLRGVVPFARLAGASYQGAGVPACIASGRRAAASLLEASAR